MERFAGRAMEKVMVRLNTQHDMLKWCPGSKLSAQSQWHEIRLDQISHVSPGHGAGDFGHHKGHALLQGSEGRSFSVVYHPGDREEEDSLDLVAPSGVAFDLWQEGLERLLS